MSMRKAALSIGLGGSIMLKALMDKHGLACHVQEQPGSKHVSYFSPLVYLRRFK